MIVLGSIGIRCDKCGTIQWYWSAKEQDTILESLILDARDYCSRQYMWSFGPSGDLCPKCYMKEVEAHLQQLPEDYEYIPKNGENPHT